MDSCQRVASNIILCPYTQECQKGDWKERHKHVCAKAKGMDLHSPTFHLHVSTFGGIHCVVSVTKLAQAELRSGGVSRPWRWSSATAFRR